MNTKAFEGIREIVYEQSGILLADGKQSMVAARISRRLRDLRLKDELAYLDHLRADLGTEIVQLLDAISTNVTHFFREAEHFDLIAAHLEDRIKGGARRLRLWSAASSTGEEPYSLAMTVEEVLSKHERSVDARILATDISTRVLNKARAGRYEASKLDGIPAVYRRRHMIGDGEDYRVADHISNRVLFKRLNLSRQPFPMKGPLDVIMCRNVMIYFDDDLRGAIAEECRRLLSPGGLLVLGKSESLVGNRECFERAGPSTYRKKA